MRSLGGRNPFGQLVLTNWRELVRDPMTFFFILIFPFLFILIFWLISYTTQHQTFNVGVALPANVDPAVEQLVVRLESVANLRVKRVGETDGRRAVSEGEIAALVVMPASLPNGRIVVTAGPETQSAALALERFLAASTSPSGGPTIDVKGGDGRAPIDPIKFGLPGILIMAFASLAFFGTATPLVQLRQRGTLRLLGMTPVSRFTFIAAQVPTRFALGTIQLGVILLLGKLTGYLADIAMFGVILTCLLGLLFLFSVGYLAGGTLRSPEVASGLLSGLLPILLMATGVLLPLEIMPKWVATVAQFIPLTYLGDALRQQLVGGTAMHSMLINYLVLAGSTLLLTLLAVATFRWDQGDAG